MRSARIGVEGRFYDAWKYEVEADFADDDLDFRDAYIEYGGELVEPAHVRVGQYKVFNSLEWPINCLFLTFMARAAIVGAFGLARQRGVSSSVADANWASMPACSGRTRATSRPTRAKRSPVEATSSSREKIDRARDAWKAREFPVIPTDAEEFIPWPE